MKAGIFYAAALIAAFFCAGLFVSGLQTYTAYLSSYSSYGFHDLSKAYLEMSLSFTVMAFMAMVFVMRSVSGRLF